MIQTLLACRHKLFHRHFTKQLALSYNLLHYNSNLNAQNLLKESYDHGISEYKLIGKTVGQVLEEAVESVPDRESIIFYKDNKRATYAQFNEEVNQLAASFHGLGLKKGDRVGIWGQNHMEWLITFYAAARSGVILVNVNPAYQSNELKYTLNKTQIKALLMQHSFKTSNYYEILKMIAPELETCSPGNLTAESVPDLQTVVLTEGPSLPGTFSFKEVTSFGGAKEHQMVKDIQSKIQYDDPVNIQFTSGTTGLPKGATLTHHNLVNNVFLIGQKQGLSKVDRMCIPVPLYHSSGLIAGSLTGTMFGCAQVYPDRGFDSGSVLRAINDEKCTSIIGVPAMFIDILSHKDVSQTDFSSMRTGIMAGAPCPQEVMLKIMNDMKCKEMTIGYGITETSPGISITARDAPIDLRVSTVGNVVPHVELKVVDIIGKIVPVNTPGEICVRGICVFQGYWDDEEKTCEAIDKNGWFYTGDLGEIDEYGYIKISGRIKDMIIRGGENIYPAEIENFLHTHPKIENVQVVGVPDDYMGEEVCAWIKLKSDNDFGSAEEIKEFCKGQISHYKIPRYIEFVDEFPMTVTGKIKKYEIMKEMTEKLKMRDV